MIQSNSDRKVSQGPTLYRVSSGDCVIALVVADSYDEAVRKVHEYHWERRLWQQTALTSEHADRGEFLLDHVTTVTRLDTLLIP